MENTTTQNFEQGDKLLCNNSSPLEGNTIAPPVVVGTEYKANRIFKCDCGQSHIDVGCKSDHNYIRCYECKNELPDTDIHWCHPSRFDKVV